jgi:hypothetical protein
LKYSSELWEFFLAKILPQLFLPNLLRLYKILKLILLLFLIARENVHDFYLIPLIKIFNIQNSKFNIQYSIFNKVVYLETIGSIIGK